MVITFHSQGLLIYRHLILFLVNLLPSGILILPGQFLIELDNTFKFHEEQGFARRNNPSKRFFQSGKAYNIQV